MITGHKATSFQITSNGYYTLFLQCTLFQIINGSNFYIVESEVLTTVTMKIRDTWGTMELNFFFIYKPSNIFNIFCESNFACESQYIFNLLI